MSMLKAADISPCERYRYWLLRYWDPALPMMTWVMLNPSTADATVDDPTIRKCIGFAKQWGFGSFHVVNLNPFRSADPKLLKRQPVLDDDVMERNLDSIRGAMRRGTLTVCGWGANGLEESQDMVTYMQEIGPLHHITKTKSGCPGHPLYISYLDAQYKPRMPQPAS